MQISAVIVTRGDVSLGDVLDPILAAGVDEIIIRIGHAGVMERYAAAERAKHEVIYTQDDDCVVDVAAVIAAYDCDLVTCNMPEGPESHRSDYPDKIALVGWGCVFHRGALENFAGYTRRFEPDGIFQREADRVFTGLNPLKLIDVPFQHLPWAHSAYRMGREPIHAGSMKEIRRRIYAVRNG